MRAEPEATRNVTSMDEQYMAHALTLAKRALGRTHPNPAVGCVLLRDNIVVGEGFHPKAGEPHAEIFALRAAGQKAQGATAYVTLEPCNHFGRTPPCSLAFIEAKVARVRPVRMQSRKATSANFSSVLTINGRTASE